MAIHFPRVEEVRLRNTPLAEVICQVRFPPILPITSQQPAAFQDRIRNRFPIFDQEQRLSVHVPRPGDEIRPEVHPIVYRFATEDNQTAVSLSTDFCALSTTRYSHWSNFISDLELLVKTTADIYRPSFASRLGLRYINHLTLANTKTTDLAALAALLKPELTALLNSTAWSDPQEMFNQIVITNDPAKLAIRVVNLIEDSQPSLVLDFDYFEEIRLEWGDISQHCGLYHAMIYDAFRWCFQEGALEVFDPIKV